MQKEISEREKKERELRSSEEKFRNLFETMAQGVVYQDSQGNITSANPAAEEILGLTIDQMQGRTSMHPDWKAIDEAGEELPGKEHPAMVALRTGEKVENFIQGIYNPQKESYVWIIVNAIPQFREGSNQAYQVYSTFLDVTERIYSEKKMKELNEELESQNEEFISINEELRESNKAYEKINKELAEQKKKYSELFNKMISGFAYHRMIYNEQGEAVDYEFLEVNPAFERL